MNNDDGFRPIFACALAPEYDELLVEMTFVVHNYL